MTFASVWALLGLLLLIPLVFLHLRERGQPSREVSSLLLWQGVERGSSVMTRGRALPKLPLLLLLQLLIVVFLAVGLANPSVHGSVLKPGRAIVVDDSLWMSAPGRIATARRDALRIVNAAAPGTPLTIIAAGDPAPRTLYRGRKPVAARAALARLQATASPSDLAPALTVAAGAEGGARTRIYAIRAPEDALPSVTSRRGEFHDETVGVPVSDQGIFDGSARCGIGAANTCEVYATVANGSDRTVTDQYRAQTSGQPQLSGSITLRPRTDGQIVLLAAPGAQVGLTLDASDAIPVDNAAAISVPGVGGVTKPTDVTLVGTRSVALPLAQALVSTPGISLQLATPHTYRAALARKSGVLILDGWLPKHGLPPAPGIVLVDPPRLPGGNAGRPATSSVVTGEDRTSPIMTGVDLGSLEVTHGGGRSLTLPSYLQPVVWSPSGPLLAAGDNGSTRLTVLSFEPSKSNLPELSSFPVLVANIVAWSSRWVPASASVGEPFAVDATAGARTAMLALGGRSLVTERLRGSDVVFTPERPGFYTVTEHGQGVTRSLAVAASAAAPTLGTGSAVSSASATSVDLRPALRARDHTVPTPLALWFLVASLVVMAGEAFYWAMNRARVLVA